MMYATSTRQWGRIVAATGVILSMTAVSACGNGAAATDRSGKPVVTVALLQNSDAQGKLKDAQWAKELEQACGCTIKWTQSNPTSWTQQKNAVLASGDVADLSFNLYDQTDFSLNPVFEDLSDDLDKMPNVRKLLENKNNEAVKKYAYTLDGKLYQIPSYTPTIENVGTGQNWMINKTWLDKLGLKVPTTWDELTRVLEAFKTQDPNGNGKQDEIPFDINALGTNGFSWYSPFLLMNSTGISTSVTSASGSQGMYVKNGKVANFMLDDEYREVVGYLHELISKGLVPSDAMTKDSSKYNAELQSDGKTALVGMAIGWDRYAFGDLKDQYVSIATPSAPGHTAVWEQGQDSAYAGAAVKADSPNKDAIFKIIDKMVEPDVSVSAYWGDMPKYVEKRAEGDYLVKPEAMDGTAVKYGWSNRVFAFWNKGTVIDGVDDLKVYNGDLAATQAQMPGDGNYMPFYVMPDQTDNTTISNNNVAILDYVVPKTVEWIVNGGLDDAAWNDFKAGLKKLNIDQNVELWQKWYDAYAKE
ncbi:extracellular solute-binding protein [Bifidobacterium sp. 82T10]|uniref:Extracellular solute-binding protein n=1 Tax=Bifidobacterium miconis TaxID=2834435 RepID=A0ABS6WF20_9BIFI|nr:extracellular solute-binding protein [Bifidobacterium miconis]MBW3092615.1 extracellular solute-binding protein [Bifidobacterium miconis]